MWLAVFIGLLTLVPNLPQAFANPLPLWSYATMTQNFLVADSHGSLGSGWMEATWSLAVEAQFYLLFPFLIRYCPARFLPFVVIALILIAPAIRWLRADNPTAVYELTTSRMDTLLIGSLIAIAFSRWDFVRSITRRQLQIALFILLTGAALLT